MKERDLAGWMWADACELIAQAERLHRQFFRVGAPRERLRTWEPPVDVFETDGEVLLCVALPGVAAEHIEVLLEEDIITIAGLRVMPRGSAGPRLSIVWRSPMGALNAASACPRPP